MIFLWSIPYRMALRAASGSFSHGVSNEHPRSFAKLYIMCPSHVVGVVTECFPHEAAVRDAALRIRNGQFRMRELVDSETAARAAGAFRIVEDEI